MSTAYRLSTIIGLCSLLLATSPLFAGVSVRSVGRGEGWIDIEVTFPPLSRPSARGNLELPGDAFETRPGFPRLPCTGVLIPLPSIEGLTLEVLSAESEVRSGVEIPRVPEGEDAVAPRCGTEPWEEDKEFPAARAVIDTTGIMRGERLARLRLHPFHWNAQTGQLRHDRRVRLRLSFELRTPSRQIAIRRPDPARLLPFEIFARIEVKEPGLYRVTYDDLLAAGLRRRSLPAAQLALFHLGREVPIALHTRDPERFAAGDTFEFHAEGIDNLFTDTAVYHLTWDGRKGEGMRILTTDGGGAGEGSLDRFRATVHREEDHLHWSEMPGAPETDFWFWTKLTWPGPATGVYGIFLPDPLPDGEPALLRVELQGRSNAPPVPNHHVRVRFNGNVVGEGRWQDFQHFTLEAPLSPDLLIDGFNRVEVELPGEIEAPIDVVYLDAIDVTYTRRIEAFEDELRFTPEADGRLRFEIGGFTSSEVRVFDLSSSSGVSEIVPVEIATEPDGFRATFVGGGRGDYYAVGAGKIRTPEKITIRRIENLRRPNLGADYLVIAPRDFLEAARPLLTHRRRQGLRVKGVAVEDLYDLFSEGQFDPGAIRAFLQYAYENWRSPAPEYVLLLGDATLDYRDNYGTGKETRVPAHLTFSDLSGLIPDDNWYVSVDGDDFLPDMKVGRISGGDAETIATVVRKIIRYESEGAPTRAHALFAADNNEPVFEEDSEVLIGMLPSSYEVSRVYLSDYSDIDAATDDVLSAIDAGAFLTIYTGHGNITRWAGEGLLETSDIDRLTNADALTLLATFNCLNGFFAYWQEYSLGERFLLAGNGGAIAAFAPSALGYTWEHETLGETLLEEIFASGGQERLGTIVTNAKRNAYARNGSRDMLSSFSLLGDPAGLLFVP